MDFINISFPVANDANFMSTLNKSIEPQSPRRSQRTLLNFALVAFFTVIFGYSAKNSWL